tara:strand:+ start:335 stop:793 length:459 start_codon:yes stop_codon:yes gene_type:complete
MYTNLNDYFSSSYISKNIRKHPEVKKNFFTISVKTRVLDENKSVYFDEYYLDTDKNLKIHSIIGFKTYKTMKRCKLIKEQLEPMIENKYNTLLSEGHAEGPEYDSIIKSEYLEPNTRIQISCNNYHKNNKSMMWLFLISRELSNEIDNYYKF